MPRLLFTKEGPAIWMSHLDLMRTLQRAFRRGGLMLKHSQGYSPHPELSIVLPLSVGVSSVCELADFELEPDCSVPVGEIAARMNPVLPAGIRVLDCFEQGKKAGKLAWLRSQLHLTYDHDPAVPAAEASSDASLHRVAALRELFSRASLVVEKHSKKGPVELDIAPMLREVRVEAEAGDTLRIEVLGSAQNPTLNPLLLAAAIERYLPEYKPDFVQCRRLEVYDEDGNVFR